jgi:hypothetical protein
LPPQVFEGEMTCCSMKVRCLPLLSPISRSCLPHRLCAGTPSPHPCLVGFHPRTHAPIPKASPSALRSADLPSRASPTVHRA